jgi:hypothetical protein
MENCEFSETQFVIGYTRELFNFFPYTFPFYYFIHAPSTKEEKKLASDLILRHYKGNYFRFSEFYQFKRSKYFNREVFSDLKGKSIIDTSVNPKYGFNIYNSKKTKQFNTLQKLSANKRNRVYYCAPAFHAISEFNRFFGSSTIQSNSKVFNFIQPLIQSAKIPLGSNHKIVFDNTSSHICSDPIEIESLFANERFKQYEGSAPFSESDYNFEAEVKELYNFVVEEIYNLQLNESFERPEINFFEVRDMLLSYFNIYWFPHFSINKIYE